MTTSLAVAFASIGDRVTFDPAPEIRKLNAAYGLLPEDFLYSGTVVGFENYDGVLHPLILLDNSGLKVFGPLP